ncbi:hypothetical protein ACFY05_32905 [Microtetraspora fusca]|uniref:Uncharacterized protein n=1 Tax=Microtetraspora fusca TaxID=1997 RepID=A0ABW6VHB2_MICFU
MPVTICTAPPQPRYRLATIFEITPGDLIVERWTVPRGPGTLGVTFVREVLRPAVRIKESCARVDCRGDVYVAPISAGLPVVDWQDAP